MRSIMLPSFLERIVNARVAKRLGLGYINTINIKCPLALAEVWLKSADLIDW